jgi:glycosyltransferase involved in cell wall biosynthesis
MNTTDSLANEVQVTVVVPVYRCNNCLRELHRRLTATLPGLTDSYELLFVDDRSPDRSWETLHELALTDPTVRAVRLSRNFGQQAAITAGLAESRGRWIVVMDCDLQDPPELIPKLYARARSGYDVVLARRAQRSHAVSRLVAARLYHWFLRTFLGVEISGAYGAFSLLSRKVRDAFLAVPDRDRHYLPILFWLGFERTSVDFEHGERYAGESSYSFGSLIRLAVEGVFFQTTTLLRYIVYLGFGVAFLGGLWAAYVVYIALTKKSVPGYASLAVLILVIGGFIIVSTGVTGLYIGKIFGQVKSRPLYIVDSELPGKAADHPLSD